MNHPAALFLTFFVFYLYLDAEVSCCHQPPNFHPPYPPPPPRPRPPKPYPPDPPDPPAPRPPSCCCQCGRPPPGCCWTRRKRSSDLNGFEEEDIPQALIHQRPQSAITDEDPVAPKFVVALVTQAKQPYCTGSIVSRHFVLTACKKCLQWNGRMNAVSNMLVKIKNIDLDELSQFYTTKKAVVHPNCLQEPYSVRYDTGLLQTKQKIQFGPTVGPVKVPHNWNPGNHHTWVMTTFHQRYDRPILSEPIWFVETRPLEKETCKLLFNSSYYHEDYSYCTPYLVPGDPFDCMGDLGASLTVNNNLVGVMTHKLNCVRSGSPAVFAMVSHTMSWINTTMQVLSAGKEGL